MNHPICKKDSLKIILLALLMLIVLPCFIAAQKNTIIVPDKKIDPKLINTSEISPDSLNAYSTIKIPYDILWKKQNLPLIAVKSNLLYTLTASLNLGFEFRLSERYTFDISGSYNAWQFSHTRMFRHIMLQPELRYWINEPFDFDSLYASPLWDSYLHAWGLSYKEELSSNNYTIALTDACKKLIVRVAENYPQRLKPLIRTLADNLAVQGYENAAASIAAYPYGIDVSPDEYSEIANRLLIQTRLAGNKAPGITDLKTDIYPALVIFYESGCPNCIDLLDAIKTHFSLLQDKQISVISISSDNDREIFENFASQYGWKDKLCDLQGFNSPDFKRWGVASTPSLYYIDKNGIVNDPYEMEEFKFLKQ